MATEGDFGPPWSAVSNESIVELVNAACQHSPEQPAMILEDGLAVTRRQLLERVERFAAWLATRAATGDRVAVMLDTRVESLIAQLAAMAIGCPPVPINPTARQHDAGHILRDSGATVAIVGQAQARLIEGLRARLPSLRTIVSIDGSEPDGLPEGEQRLKLAGRRVRRSDIATIHYTSGTTGTPKGCMLSHNWWLRLCDVHLRMTPHRPDDRPLCCIPFHYPDSLFLLLCTLHAAETLVVMRRFSVSRFWPVVAESGSTLLYLIASMPILLLKQAVTGLERRHRLRAAICAGVPASLHRELTERFGVPFIDTYGSTEAGWVTRVPWNHASGFVGSGSVGVTAPECELQFVGDDGRSVAPGAVGELLVRAPGLFSGYLNQPDATAEALRDGWYRTGDMARRDEAGRLYFLGRKKDIVRRAGENISCAEVEAVLRLHPLVRDAAVVPVPDDIRGEEVKAVILLTEGAAVDNVMPAEIIDHCAAHLAAFKIPRFVAYRETDFPRTPTMRVRKEELRAEADATAGCWDRLRQAWR